MNEKNELYPFSDEFITRKESNCWIIFFFFSNVIFIQAHAYGGARFKFSGSCEFKNGHVSTCSSSTLGTPSLTRHAMAINYWYWHYFTRNNFEKPGKSCTLILWQTWLFIVGEIIKILIIFTNMLLGSTIYSAESQE